MQPIQQLQGSRWTSHPLIAFTPMATIGGQTLPVDPEVQRNIGITQSLLWLK